MDLSSRFQGCLVGLAIGDALGMPFEFMSPEQIDWRLHGDFDFHPAHTPVSGQLRAGQWTDDTKMALCVAESLVERRGVDGAHLASKYLDWYRSRDWRGIGTTTQLALSRLEAGAPWTESGRRGTMAAGNGAAMRIAPVGLWHARDRSGLLESVRAATISTHHCDEAVHGAAAVAFAIARAAGGESDAGSLIDATCSFLGPCTMCERLRRAQEFQRSGRDSPGALAELGTGGYVLETVASAFYCATAAAGDFARGVEMAVRAGGDTDTTGAVTGALLGAQVGLAGLPARWLDRVEAGPRIAELARQLCGVVYG